MMSKCFLLPDHWQLCEKNFWRICGCLAVCLLMTGGVLFAQTSGGGSAGSAGAAADRGAAAGPEGGESRAAARRDTAGKLIAAKAGPVADLDLVRSQAFFSPDEFAHYHGAGNNEQVLRSKHHNILAEYNPVSLVLKGMLLGYQKLMSEQLARSCPYEISCSNFSKQSIQQFGAFKGVFISADRILRCNRIGYEDVSPLSINPATGRIIDSPNMYR